MGDRGDTPNSNSDNEGQINESSDDDEESSTMEQAQPIVRESTRSSQPSMGVASNATTHQITDQLIVRESNNSASSRYTIMPSQYCGIDIHFLAYWLMLILMGLTIGQSLYWFILVLIGLVIYVIDAIRHPVWTYDNQFRVRLGDTQPWPSDYTLGLNQGGTGAGRIASPSDSLQPLIITYTFSRTITEYLPLRESTPVEDTQPPTMPAAITDNNIGPGNRIANDENRHRNTDEIIQNNYDEITPPPAHIESPAMVVGNGVTGIPDELARDFDPPVTIHEHQNGNESDTSSDDELLVPESFLYVDSNDEDDELTRSINQRGETITGVDQTNTPPNQSNLNDEQSTATTSAIDASSPQIPVTERNVDAPTEGGPRMRLPAMNPIVTNDAKMRTPSSSSDESTEETGVN